MLPFQIFCDIVGVIADVAIVTFFIIELRGEAKDRILRAKQSQILEQLMQFLNTKTEQEIGILEEVHAELADIADKTPEILEEGQDEPDTNRDNISREAGEVGPTYTS